MYSATMVNPDDIFWDTVYIIVLHRMRSEVFECVCVR